MTLYIIFDVLKSGKLKLDSKFKTSKLATMQIPSKVGLKVGEKISIKDLILSLAVKSANDAAVVVAEGLCGSVAKFCKLMNKKARLLGMMNTNFVNPSGVPSKNQISTAKDVALLGIALYKNFPQYWHFLSKKSFIYKGTSHHTHCKILHWYKGADGAKTGYIAASGFNLFVTANKYNKKGRTKRVYVVVMGGDSQKSRDLFAASLMDKYLADYKIFTTKVNKTTQRKSLLDQIAKSDMDEAIIQEDEVFDVSEILASASFDKKDFDKLYEDEEEDIQIEGEIYIEASEKRNKKRIKKHH